MKAARLIVVGVLLAVIALAVAQRPPSAPPSVPDNAAVFDDFLGGTREPGSREGVYRGAYGAELGFLGYLAGQADHRIGVVYFHGIESHAGWFDMAARMLQEAGIDVFCLDRRGSGINRDRFYRPVMRPDALGYAKPIWGWRGPGWVF